MNILYVHYGDNGLRGSEQCLLHLLKQREQLKVTPVVWSNNAALILAAKQLGITTLTTAFTLLLGWQKPRFNIGQTLKQIKQGVRLIRQHKIDLVHCNSAAPMQWMQYACKYTQTKLLTHLHAPYPLRDRLTLGIANADKIVCVNQALAQQCIEDGVHHCRVMHISNGVDMSQQNQVFPLDLKAQLALPKTAKLLMTVASLQHEKGVDVCIHALAQVAHKSPVHLAVVGDGPMHDRLVALTQSLGLTDRVHFLGDSDIVASLLAANVDAFVCGSRAESFGLAIAEAMLAKCPVVAPKVGGIPMLVKPHQTGLLYPPENTQAFARHIESVLTHPNEATQRAEQAYQHVCSRFTLAQYIQHFALCYQNLLTDSQSKKNKLFPAYLKLFKLAFRVHFSR